MAESKVQRNLQAMKDFYAAAAAGKSSVVQAMLSDNLVITEGSSLPYAGEYTGKDALRTISKKVSAYYGGMTLDIHEYCAGGDWVMTLLDIRPAGKDDRIPLVEASRFDQDGKIVEIKPFYFDHDLVKRLGV